MNCGGIEVGDLDGALTVEAFCEKYNVGRTSFYEEVAAGRLQARKRGARTLISRDEARRWFNGLPTLGAKPAAAMSAAA